MAAGDITPPLVAPVRGRTTPGLLSPSVRACPAVTCPFRDELAADRGAGAGGAAAGARSSERLGKPQAIHVQRVPT